ncbi:hypothetical protein Aab01nite_51600 [Paractinoplanes abujensis]|uniref:Uncharacterized protein n=1 Tax=Paractinoplanes abujensis TaxID=882441 RepID=A0A7W7G147_9ACTN|nr:hypothetical protein [Actinoplanes abujensis]MBB4693773.1 hypothetical protein [Actinoplanes abujensis]GID21570.1 hypothetical protein Aab01nite_51600 [Actinoplanes abujensis]
MATNARIKPVEKATNRTWDEWLAFMDGIGARELDHKQIALAVHHELDGTGVEPLGWWTQAVTVAYEQFIGRRIPGQRPDGTFQMSVSKSTTMGMQELMNAWAAYAPADPYVTGLLAADATPRISGTDRRITWRVNAADGSQIIVTSEPKPNGTASIVAAQLGLATPKLNDQARAGWAAVVKRFLTS